MENNFLDKILISKREEVKTLEKEFGLTYFQDRLDKISIKKNNFFDALAKPNLSLIGELKKASPSKGLINPSFEPVSLAKNYIDNGASALSILTEKHYFLGNPQNIAKVKEKYDISVLRKDFIIDPIQVYEAKLLGADAILLIKAILSLEKCEELLTLAKSLDLDVLMEVHDDLELQDVLTLNQCDIIGINNRNLKTFDVDIDLARRLKEKIDAVTDNKRRLVVAESGYQSGAELKQLESESFSAVLVGEGLVKQPEMISFFKDKVS